MPNVTAVYGRFNAFFDWTAVTSNAYTGLLFIIIKAEVGLKVNFCNRLWLRQSKFLFRCYTTS